MDNIEKIDIKFEKEPKAGIVLTTQSDTLSDDVIVTLKSMKENFAFTGYEVCVCIIDMAQEEVKKLKSSEIVKGSENIKFASYKGKSKAYAINNAVRTKLADDTDILMLCEPTIRFENDVLSLLSYIIIEYSQTIGVVGCRIMRHDGYIENVGLYINENMGFGPMMAGSPFEKEKYEGKNMFKVDGIPHMMLVTPKAYFSAMNGVDEYRDDIFIGIDLSTRMSTMGKTNYVITDGVCTYGREVESEFSAFTDKKKKK